jgi:hypothetical protein
MTPAAMQVTITYSPADQAQMTAWQWLWTQLLAPDPENNNAPEVLPSGACADDGVRQHANLNGGEPYDTTDQLS